MLLWHELCNELLKLPSYNSSLFNTNCMVWYHVVINCVCNDMSCMNYLIHAMLLSNKKSWGWRSKMSEFAVFCFYVYIRWRIPFSISMSIVPPKAIGAIILSFIIFEALPILLYLSLSNGNTPTNMSHLACLKSSLPIESCNPSVTEYRFQQLYGMNQVLSVVSLLQLFYQGLSIEHFNSSWACLKLSKTIPVYLSIQIDHIVWGLKI